MCVKTYQPPAASAGMSNPFVGKTLVVTGKVEPYTRDGINTKIESLGAHAARTPEASWQRRGSLESRFCRQMSSSAWPEKVHKDIAGDWHTVSRFNYLGELEGTVVKS